jgi:hypothetical protein
VTLFRSGWYHFWDGAGNASFRYVLGFWAGAFVLQTIGHILWVVIKWGAR